jgi:hypothetical protein
MNNPINTLSELAESSFVKFTDKIQKITSEGLFSIAHDFIKNEVNDPLTIDDFSASYEKTCDKIIINAKKYEDLDYVSGVFKINLKDENQFDCTADFYFKNKNEKWVTKKSSSGNFKMTEKLTLDAIKELISVKTIKIEITPPKKP